MKTSDASHDGFARRTANAAVAAGFLVSLVAFAAPVGAHMPKRISVDHSDSLCIGDVSSSICAFETWIACHALHKPELCARLGVANMRFKPDRERLIHQYVIVDALPVTSVRLPERSGSKVAIAAGDLELRVMEKWCSTPEECQHFSLQPSVLYLRRERGEWRLAAWTNDSSVQCEYVDPDEVECDWYFYDESTPWVHDSKWQHEFDRRVDALTREHRDR